MKRDLLRDLGIAAGPSEVAVVGDRIAAPLTRGQKQFNKLIDRLGTQRQELARWQAFKQDYYARLASDYQPLAARLRTKRRAMVTLLARALADSSLGNRERNKVREILLTLLGELLADREEADLIALYDQHSDDTYAHSRERQLKVLKARATTEYGVDADSYDGAADPEEFKDWLDEQIRSSEPPPETPEPAKTKKSAKALERERLKAETAEGGTRAVREVFRRLASELHPDREPDAAERQRKTELMKQVNVAYKASDLLGLLELQLSIEQIDQSALAGLAEDRLKHYCHVLEEQSDALKQELAELIAPFTMAMTEDTPAKLTPGVVLQSLEMDIRDLKAMLKDVELMLTCFQDIRHLKQSLGRYQIDADRSEAWDEDSGRPQRRRR